MKARAGGARRIRVPPGTSKCHEDGAYLWPGLHAWPWCRDGSLWKQMCQPVLHPLCPNQLPGIGF